MFVMTLRHKSPVISPHSCTIVAVQSSRFAGVAGNALSFRKPQKRIEVTCVQVGAEWWREMTAVVTIRITV
jgi:hypothetical protein